MALPIVLSPRTLFPQIQHFPWDACAIVARKTNLDPADHPNLLQRAAWPQNGQNVLTWRSTKRRKHWLAGRLAALDLNDQLRHFAQDSPLQVSTDQNGAPQLQEGKNTLPINITHSGDFALAAAAPGHALGIDFETGIHDQFHLTRRICAPGEAERFQIHNETVPHERRARHLGQIWTLKEAILKAYRVGLIARLQDFEVEDITPTGRAHFRALAPLHEDIPHPLPLSLWAAVTSWQGHPLSIVSIQET